MDTALLQYWIRGFVDSFDSAGSSHVFGRRFSKGKRGREGGIVFCCTATTPPAQRLNHEEERAVENHRFVRGTYLTYGMWLAVNGHIVVPTA